MIDEWDLTTTNLHRASQRQYEVAVIPTAAIEPHNLHLPEGMDFFHTTHIARRCCKDAYQRCESVLCLPTLPFGVDCNLLGCRLAIHVSQAALDATLRDIVVSLRHHGIRKIVILNGHGGNDFFPFVRQIQYETDVYVFLCNWWTVALDRYAEIFEKPDDHAGEFETSVALAICPELVELDKAGDGRPRDFRFEALRKRWVGTSRDFAKINDVCAAGDPAGASAEKGRKYLDLTCGRVTDFLVELAKSQIDESFPHVP